MTFFESLTKPSWIPPDWAFPAAWFTLWTLQAIALVVLISSDRGGRPLATGLLVAQFVAALVWQGIWGPGRLVLAACWLLGVLVLVVAAVVAAWRVDWRAGALVAPTIVWVAVATALGFALVRLNPGA